MTDIADALAHRSASGCVDLGDAGNHRLVFLPLLEDGVLRACCNDCGAGWVLGALDDLAGAPLVPLLTEFRDGVANGLEPQSVVPELIGCLGEVQP